MKTLAPPKGNVPVTGTRRCDGCNALLEYEEADLREWKRELVPWENQTLAEQQQYLYAKKRPAVKKQPEWYVICPHCASELLISDELR